MYATRPKTIFYLQGSKHVIWIPLDVVTTSSHPIKGNRGYCLMHETNFEIKTEQK